MKKLVNYILFIVNIVAAAGMVAAYLGTHISPSFFWPLAFFGLIFPYLLIVNILFLFYWTIVWNKRAFVSIVVIILGLSHIIHIMPMLRVERDMDQKKEGDLKILSYNVRAFNIYDWLHDPKTNKGILNFIRSEHPDVICLQEFYSDKSTKTPSINYLRLFGENPYKHVVFSDNENRYGHGIATFSKYPIIRKGEIPFKNSNNLCIYTDILFQGDTLRVYNNHLQSVSFRHNNYRALEQIRLGENPPKINELRDITSRLKNAYIKRSEQTDLLKAHAKKSTIPVIICGDFNDTPVSYTYRKLSRKMNDAFLTAGKGSGNNYHGRISFRIDYILYSDDFEASDFEKVEANLSDHYPIIAVLRKTQAEIK